MRGANLRIRAGIRLGDFNFGSQGGVLGLPCGDAFIVNAVAFLPSGAVGVVFFLCRFDALFETIHSSASSLLLGLVALVFVGFIEEPLVGLRHLWLFKLRCGLTFLGGLGLLWHLGNGSNRLGRLGLALDGAAQGLGLIGVALASGFQLAKSGTGFGGQRVLAGLGQGHLGRGVHGLGCRGGDLFAGQVEGVRRAGDFGLCRWGYGCYGLGLWLGRGDRLRCWCRGWLGLYGNGGWGHGGRSRCDHLRLCRWLDR